MRRRWPGTAALAAARATAICAVLACGAAGAQGQEPRLQPPVEMQALEPIRVISTMPVPGIDAATSEVPYNPQTISGENTRCRAQRGAAGPTQQQHGGRDAEHAAGQPAPGERSLSRLRRKPAARHAAGPVDLPGRDATERALRRYRQLGPDTAQCPCLDPALARLQSGLRTEHPGRKPGPDEQIRPHASGRGGRSGRRQLRPLLPQAPSMGVNAERKSRAGRQRRLHRRPGRPRRRVAGLLQVPPGIGLRSHRHPLRHLAPRPVADDRVQQAGGQRAHPGGVPEPGPQQRLQPRRRHPQRGHRPELERPVRPRQPLGTAAQRPPSHRAQQATQCRRQ